MENNIKQRMYIYIYLYKTESLYCTAEISTFYDPLYFSEKVSIIKKEKICSDFWTGFVA